MDAPLKPGTHQSRDIEDQFPVDRSELRAARASTWLSSGLLVFFTAAAVHDAMARDAFPLPTEHLIIYLLVLVMLSGCAIISVLFRRQAAGRTVFVNDEGVWRGVASAPDAFVRWEDVRDIRMRALGYRLDLLDTTGDRVLRVHLPLDRQNDFFRLVMERTRPFRALPSAQREYHASWAVHGGLVLMSSPSFPFSAYCFADGDTGCALFMLVLRCINRWVRSVRLSLVHAPR